MKTPNIDYYISKKGQKILGSKDCNIFLNLIHMTSGFQKHINSIKSIVIFKSSEFFNGSSLRILTKKMTRNNKKY